MPALKGAQRSSADQLAAPNSAFSTLQLQTPLASRNRSHSSSLLPLSRRCKTSHRIVSRAAAQMLIGRLSSSACFAQLKLAQSRSMARGVLWKFNSLTPSHSLQLVSVRGLPLNARQKLSGQPRGGGRSRIISSFQVVFLAQYFSSCSLTKPSHSSVVLFRCSAFLTRVPLTPAPRVTTPPT